MACSLLARDSARSPGSSEEKHLRNIQQLTFGGQNAEAYFSGDGRKLIFQSTHGDVKCDQILTMNIDGSEVRMVSTGKGRTTCTKAHAQMCSPRMGQRQVPRFKPLS